MSEELRSWIQRLSDPNISPWPKSFFSCKSSSGIVRSSDPTHEEEISNAVYKGPLGADGVPHGSGTLSYSNGDTVITEFDEGVRHGETVITSPRHNISRLVGNYDHGYFQGPGQIITTKTSSYECFFKDSMLHGPLRKMNLKKFREFRRQVSFIGLFKNGLPAGPCWAYLEGGGFLFAHLFTEGPGLADYDQDFTQFFTSRDCAYIFPDFKTAYIGEFFEGEMVGAQEAEVMSVDQQSGILIPVLKLTEPTSPSVHYFKSTRDVINDQPLVPDPYESRWIECRSSMIDGGGQGLYARADIPSGTIVAFYNGVRIPYELGGPKESWSSSGYKIFINADYESGERMNIPEEFIDLCNYSASLGHKMNHSFDANCSEWFFHHPRFGLIPCERTTRDIKAGEELFLDYEYDPHNCPEWFSSELDAFLSRSDENEAKISLLAKNPKYSRYNDYLISLKEEKK